MSSILTNRDLYLAITSLSERHRFGSRQLEEYLRVLWAIARSFRTRSSLSVNEFVGLLSDAFTLPIPPFEEAWRGLYTDDSTDPLIACLASKMRVKQLSAGEARSIGFGSWESFVLRQIVDLREMAEQGILADEERYFGIDSPRGQRWYNFDPCTFLECAVAGSLGGWQSGDDTGREYVPGQVAVMSDDGKVEVADPEDVPDPVISIGELSWETFQSFLGCGQWYE